MQGGIHLFCSPEKLTDEEFEELKEVAARIIGFCSLEDAKNAANALYGNPDKIRLSTVYGEFHA